EGMNLRGILLSRFVTVPAAIAVVVGLWNIYVAMHANGVLEGQVVDASGRPVAGATVVLSAHDFVTQVEKSHTTTGADGRFRFTDNNPPLVRVRALNGRRAPPRIPTRLWFRAQARVLDQPLRLQPSA